MNKIKVLAGQTVIYGLGTIVPRLFNYLLLTPFYTRIFNTHQYGSITELYSYIAFLMILLTYGMETTFFRFYETKDENKHVVFNSILSSILTTTFLFLIVCLFISKPIGKSLNYNDNYILFIYMGIIVGLDAITSIPFAKLRSENKAVKFSIIKITNVSCNIFFNILFLIIIPKFGNLSHFELLRSLYEEPKLINFAFISNLLASFITLIMLYGEFKDFKFSLKWRILKPYLLFSFPLLIVGIAGMINDVADKIMLRFLLPDYVDKLKEVGIYGANYKLAVLMTIFIQMFKYAAEPFFFANKDESDNQKLFSDVMKWFVIFCLIIFLGVTLFIDFIKLFIGSDFHSGLSIVPMILLGNMFLGIYYNLSIWYKISNKTHVGAYIAVFGAGVTIILNIILVPLMGYYGAAVATILCYFLMMVVNYIVGQYYYPIDYKIGRISFYFGLSLIIFACSYFWHLHIFIRLILFSIFFIVIGKVENVTLKQFRFW